MDLLAVTDPTGLPVRRPPTHIMRVEIPLNMTEPAPDFDAVSDALKLALAVSRAAYSRNICNDPQVTMTEVEA